MRDTGMPNAAGTTELAVVASGRGAEAWKRQLEVELHRTHNLSSSPMRADGLVVVIDNSFPNLMKQGGRKHDECFEAIRNALDAGKMLLPVTVGNAPMPESGKLPSAICAIGEFQALVINRESDLPGVAARLVVATRTLSRPYVPAKTADRRVFISYRREDSWYWASLLARALTQRLGAHNVFFDIGSIAPGRRFDREIQSRIHDATDFVILVGSTYLATDQKGRRRLDDPADFVRREITTAIEAKKQIHVVLAGDTGLPARKHLPAGVAPAFEGSAPQQLKDYRDADSVASAILSIPLRSDGTDTPKRPAFAPLLRVKPLVSLPHADPSRFLTSQQKAERFIMAALPPLAALDWQPVDLAKSKGQLVMTRPDAEGYRFVFDFENYELILEERARSVSGLGLKRWVKRAIFPVTPDAPDIDVLRVPDRQLEAMENPGAYLDRTGRLDLDMGSQPPMRPAQADRFLRTLSQPGQRALEQQAREQACVRAGGGLHVLGCEHQISLGEKVIARAVAVNPFTGLAAAASDHGVFTIDIQAGSAERFGPSGNLKHLSFSNDGLLAISDDAHHISVLDSQGTQIVKRRNPYSVWKRATGTHGFFESLSWSSDGSRLAIGASDRIWIYNLGTDAFEEVALQQDGQITSAVVLFVPETDDLLIMHLWKVWKVSQRTGEIIKQLDIATGSECYDAHSSIFSGDSSGGMTPKCLTISADGKRLAVGGNDAQLILIDGKTLRPTAMHVWHAPLVDSRWNGEVHALAFSPDGRWLASVANDSRLVVGDARSGNPIADGILAKQYAWNDVPVDRHVCWSLDCARVVVVNAQGAIEIWNTEPIE